MAQTRSPRKRPDDVTATPSADDVSPTPSADDVSPNVDTADVSANVDTADVSANVDVPEAEVSPASEPNAPATDPEPAPAAESSPVETALEETIAVINDPALRVPDAAGPWFDSIPRERASDETEAVPGPGAAQRTEGWQEREDASYGYPREVGATIESSDPDPELTPEPEVARELGDDPKL